MSDVYNIIFLHVILIIYFCTTSLIISKMQLQYNREVTPNFRRSLSQGMYKQLVAMFAIV